MFTVIYIDFFSLHQIDLKLTTLPKLKHFRVIAQMETVGLEANEPEENPLF